MHEEEDDEGGFDGGDEKGDDGIEGTEVDEGDGLPWTYSTISTHVLC